MLKYPIKFSVLSEGPSSIQTAWITKRSALDGAFVFALDLDWRKSKRKCSAYFRKDHTKLYDTQFSEYAKNFSI